MKHTLIMIPSGIGVGLTAVSLGLLRAFEKQGVKPAFFNPWTSDNLNKLLGHERQEALIEHIIEAYESVAQDADITIVQGIISTMLRTYAPRLNHKIAQALDAEVIFVAAPANRSLQELEEQIAMLAEYYGGPQSPKVLGCIVNKIGAPTDQYGATRFDLFDIQKKSQKITVTQLQQSPFFQKNDFTLIGAIEWNRKLMAPRVIDIARFLKAEILFEGHIKQNRIEQFVVAAATIESLSAFFLPHVLIITPGDRQDIILATCMAFLNGVQISALLLTGKKRPSKNTLNLCQKAFDQGLPVLRLETDTLRTSIQLQEMDFQIPDDDKEKLENIKETFSCHIRKQWIEQTISTEMHRALTPVAFRYQLTKKACSKPQRIILPESCDPRILQAAALATEKGIARITLLGDESSIRRRAKDSGIALPDGITITNPNTLVEKYVPMLIELRKHKGVNETLAREALDDPTVLATMMLHDGAVDGLVSGAVNTTAHTIRPALQLIRTQAKYRIVSSVFFMCLPDKVCVYGDCAVNQNPSAEDLVDIAIQSAESAEKFGIEPKIAMISYSTGVSGAGKDVEKVREATELARKKRPDLLIDGPLQYDAASTPSVAKSKAPNSRVAGEATVFIFPDLNTGNTTYKAVQRSAHVISIGPMLQGLNKPVNDLSRGATVDDILYTIALTAVQAQ